MGKAAQRRSTLGLTKCLVDTLTVDDKDAVFLDPDLAGLVMDCTTT